MFIIFFNIYRPPDIVLMSSSFLNFDGKTELSCTGDKSLFLFSCLSLSLCFAKDKRGIQKKFIIKQLNQDLERLVKTWLTFLFCLLFMLSLYLEITAKQRGFNTGDSQILQLCTKRLLTHLVRHLESFASQGIVDNIHALLNFTADKNIAAYA